jgi:hypothetical protein
MSVRAVGELRFVAVAQDDPVAVPLLTELENEIAGRGYRRIYLMTGDRQPEAEALYLSTGYTRLEQPRPSTGPIYPVAFEKALS